MKGISVSCGCSHDFGWRQGIRHDRSFDARVWDRMAAVAERAWWGLVSPPTDPGAREQVWLATVKPWLETLAP